jgi:hypothetical protein
MINRLKFRIFKALMSFFKSEIKLILDIIDDEGQKAFEAGRLQYKDSHTYIYESYEEYKKNIE